MEEKSKFDEKTVMLVRSAIEDRALWLYALFKQMKAEFGSEKAEIIARKAIYEYGKIKSSQNPNMKSPHDWIDMHNKGINHLVFSSTTKKTEQQDEQKFTYCPLMEAWKKVGCTKDEIDLLCSMAMEGDNGMASGAGIALELPKRLAAGDDFCHFILKKNK